MTKQYVLIIERIAPFSQQIEKQLATNSAFHIVLVTDNVETGLKTLTERHVDVILLDASLLELTGKPFLKRFFNLREVAVIMLSDSSVEQTAKTVQAMIAGAVDFIKFSAKTSRILLENEQELIRKIKLASKRTEQKRLRTKRKKIAKNDLKKLEEQRSPRQCIRTKRMPLVVIGTSTGGPRALQQIMKKLPQDINASFLIVQHMPSGFTKSLANRLNEISKINIKEAVHGEIVECATAYVAPGDKHMVVHQYGSQLKIKINEDAPRSGHRPSVDYLFESVSKLEDVPVLAIVLTGMGRDGARGIKAIKQKQKGAVVLVESKKTAIIYGMPYAVIATSKVNEVLELDEIAPAIIDYVSDRGN